MKKKLKYTCRERAPKIIYYFDRIIGCLDPSKHGFYLRNINIFMIFTFSQRHKKSIQKKSIFAPLGPPRSSQANYKGAKSEILGARGGVQKINFSVFLSLLDLLEAKIAPGASKASPKGLIGVPNCRFSKKTLKSCCENEWSKKKRYNSQVKCKY